MSGDRHLGGPAAALIVVALIACSRTAAAPLVAPGAPAPAAPPSTPAGASAPQREVAAARLPGDSDGDGIRDDVDRCVDAIELRNGVEDDDGCPDQGEVKVEVKAEKIEIYEKIYFELDKAIIRPISFSILDQVVRVIVRNPQIKKIRIEGHTDSQGTDAYNLDLSRRRAAAVMEYLTTAGVDPSRLESEGYGESKPIDTNDTKEGRANNRRVEFTILEQEPRKE